MMRILGIDPGSRITGYGIIDIDGKETRHVTSGCVRLGDAPFPERLRLIFDGICGVVSAYRPTETAIEQVFTHRNSASALKLGQARGAAMTACATQSVPVHEYSARLIKQAIVGNGNAAKAQVQHMVKVLLSLTESPEADAADALAVALCHYHTQQMVARVLGRHGPLRRRQRRRLV